MTQSDSRHGQVVASAAEVYDAFFVPALFGQFAQPLLDAAEVATGHRVLDVGCGTGVLARAAARRVGPTGSVTGVDRNPAMLAVAGRSPEAVRWTEARAEALPAPDAGFDRVVSQFVLMFVDDLGSVTDELWRVLAPTGRLAVATWADASHSPGYAALIALLDRQLGRAAGDALRAPFSLGTPELLRRALPWPEVDVRRCPGTARFASIDAWLDTEIRGWTLAGTLDAEGFAALLAESRTKLAEFARPDGSVAFPAPALIATATKHA